jgi:PAS domain S-box-containing protein
MKRINVGKFSASVLRTTLIYTFLSGLWIFISDRLLNTLISEKDLLTEWQTYKEWIFVALTAVGLFTLLSARRRAEEASHQSETRLHSALDSMLEGCQIIGFDWRYIYVNDAAAAQGKQTKEMLAGRTMMEIYPGIENTELFAVLKQCMDQRIPHKMENKFDYPDGTSGWFELSIQPVPEGLFVLSMDVTEHRKAERALRHSEQKFSTLFEKAASAVSLSTLPDGVIVDVNDAFERAFGYTKQEAAGKTSLELGINPDDEGRVRVLAALNEQGSARNLEMALHTKSGELRFFSVNVDFVDIGNQKYILNTTQDITERQRAEEKIQEQVAQLSALRQIDQTILGSLNLDLNLDIILKIIANRLGFDAASVLLFNPRTRTLEAAAGYGFRAARESEKFRMMLHEGIAGKIVVGRKAIHISDLSNYGDRFAQEHLVQAEGFVSYIGMPLIAKGKVVGVLQVFHRASLPNDPDWLSYLETVAGQTALAIDDAALFSDLQRSNHELVLAYETTLEGWSAALDLRDEETAGHTQRVTAMTLNLAKRMGVEDDEMVHIRRGALLHDIGKMGVPDYILLKPDKLTDEEWEKMRMHPVYAHDLLSRIAYLKTALDIPYCHHEKWDGTGYPRGLKGEQIPFAARIFAIVDVYDALTSDRPYRKAWTKEKVLEYIKSLSGKHFDPKVVDAFLDLDIHINQ